MAIDTMTSEAIEVINPDRETRIATDDRCAAVGAWILRPAPMVACGWAHCI